LSRRSGSGEEKAASKRADLVLLDSDPVESAQHLRAIVGVIRGGRCCCPAELDAIKDKAAAGPVSELAASDSTRCAARALAGQKPHFLIKHASSARRPATFHGSCPLAVLVCVDSSGQDP